MSIVIEEGLYAFLVTNLTTVTSRVYPIRLPQTVTLPAIIYQRISTGREKTHDQTAAGLAYPRFQFTSYAGTHASCKEVTNQLRSILAGFKGVFTVGADTVRVDGILPEGEQDFYEPDSGIYFTTSDYFVYHAE